MHHPVLGFLKLEGKMATGHLTLESIRIPLSIDAEDCSIEEALSLASAIAENLASYDQVAKEVISKDLLETYNGGWNEYSEAQDDGSFKTVINPLLGDSEFKGKFNLKSVSIASNSCVELWYEDQGLFWGHSVFVQSLEGKDFCHARALSSLANMPNLSLQRTPSGAAEHARWA